MQGDVILSCQGDEQNNLKDLSIFKTSMTFSYKKFFLFFF